MNHPFRDPTVNAESLPTEARVGVEQGPSAASWLRTPVPLWIYALCWVALLPVILGENPGLAILGGVIASLLPMILWRHGEVPTLLWVCLWQLGQAFIPVLQAELAGVSLGRYAGGEEFESAAQLSLLGVFCFAGGAALAARWVAPARQTPQWSELRALLPKRLVFVWLVLSLSLVTVSTLLQGSGILQIVQPLLYIYLGAILLLFQYVLFTQQQWIWAWFALGTEIVMGFLGYFGGFKTVIFLFVLASVTFADRRRKVWAQVAAMLLLAVGLGNFWQAIKSDYRRFVGGGEEGQVVNVSLSERLGYLQNALDAMSWETYRETMDSTLERIGYITYFGHCLRNVPAGVPHSDGRLWREAVAHVFMPRILFPNKQEFNDSDRTNEFTGVSVADVTQGTSIGIGYVGESYVDFGVPGMFVPIFMFGVAVGAGYGLLVRLAPNPLIGAAFGTAMLMRSGFLLESSNAKMLGGLVITVGVYVVVLKLFGKPLMRWISVSPALVTTSETHRPLR